MIVSCPSCSARYKLDDSKIAGRGAKITCPRCKHVFIVRPPQAAAAPAPTPPQPDPTPASRPAEETRRMLEQRRSAEALDFQKVGISLKVKVKIGLVFDFSDLRTLRRYIQEGRVTPEDTLSADGQTWRVIGDIPDLDAYIVELYEAAEADLQTQGGGGDFEEEDPTTIIGMGNLGNNLAQEALRQLSGGGDSSASSGIRSAPTPPTPAPHSNDLGDRDPFAALIEQQQQQRRNGGRPANRKKPAGKSKDSGGSGGRTVLVFAALGLFVLGGWWFTRAPTEANTDAPTTAHTQPTPTPPEGTATTVQETLDQIMDEIESEEPQDLVDEYEEPELRAVVPEEFRNGGTPNQGSDSISASEPSYPPPPNLNGGSGLSVAAESSASDHEAIGDSKASQGNWGAAASAYGKAATMSRSPSLLLKYGKALYHSGDYNNAETQLNQARGLAEASKYLGHIANQHGDVTGAVQHYKTYLAQNPNDSDVQRTYDQLQGNL